jgi:hypothetical protein
MARLQCDIPLVYVLLIQLFSSLCYEVQHLSSLQSQILTPLNFVAYHNSLCRRSSCEEGARYFIFIFKETPGSSNLVPYARSLDWNVMVTKGPCLSSDTQQPLHPVFLMVASKQAWWRPLFDNLKEFLRPVWLTQVWTCYPTNWILNLNFYWIFNDKSYSKYNI